MEFAARTASICGKAGTGADGADALRVALMMLTRL
jgi:hypothetical protein